MENHDPDDPLAMYVLEASKVKPLTKMEETKLFRELGHGHWGDFDEQRENALRRLAESRLMLIVSNARKHLAAGVPVVELMQEGNVGLMKAVISFAERTAGDKSRLHSSSKNPPVSINVSLRTECAIYHLRALNYLHAPIHPFK